MSAIDFRNAERAVPDLRQFGSFVMLLAACGYIFAILLQ